jgi:carbamoyltransferase
MNWLGIYGYDANKPKRGYRHNGSAALIRDGKVLFAMEEERLSRIKNDAAYPLQAIECALEEALEKGAVDQVALAGWSRMRFFWDTMDNYRLLAKQAPSDASRSHYRKRLIDFPINTLGAAILGLPNVPHKLSGKHLERIRHHDAHAGSAYYCAPWNKGDILVITLDAAGDAHCGGVWIGKNGKLEQQCAIAQPHSVGGVYSSVTTHLGFKPHRHEGKVLGLAAYGDPLPFGDKLLAHVDLAGDYPRFDGTLLELAYGRFAGPILDEMTEGMSREEIAAGIQYFTETVLVHFVRAWVQRTGISKIAVAGGVFANVKLNQRILEIEEVENLYIHPNMGDGGLAVGAALVACAEANDGMQPQFLDSCYLGPDISAEAADAALAAAGIAGETPADLASAVAELLASGKVVARAAGRMEYGPRALGNRTLFASCSDPTINKWLNERLQRTEFMPFAPIIMEEYAAEYFPEWKPEHVAARFMTITYDAAEIAKKNIPAAIHVDGTARPQVLREADNPEVYAILKAFHARTGVPALINTSFNMHEEPIVCSAADAVRAYQLGNIDALIVGNRLTRGEKA